MSSSKTLLWITLALCGAMGGSKVVYEKRGQEASLDCADEVLDSQTDIEWKNNDLLIIKMIGKSGSTAKGPHVLRQKAKMAETTLKIPSVEPGESGVYSCSAYKNGKKQTWEHKLHVVSASVSPSSTVLISSVVTLKCDIAGDSKTQVQWLRPPGNKSYENPERLINLQSVTSADSGKWFCRVKVEKNKTIDIKVDLNVAGPLKSSEEVVAPPGGAAELTCYLPNPHGMTIVGGGWARKGPETVHFPKLTRDTSGLRWNNTGVQSRVTFKAQQQLDTNFTVKLTKLERADSGVYVCTVEFKGGKNLSTELKLKVEGEIVGAASENGSMNKMVLGVKLWVWLAVGAASVLLIVLVVIVVLIHRRNKHMRRKVRKLRSMRQPLAPRRYCQCERIVGPPHPAGKKERPPPLPRYQYDVMD